MMIVDVHGGTRKNSLMNDFPLAAKLSKIYDTQIESCDGGFKMVKPNGRDVFVLRMLYNWRVARDDLYKFGYDRGWCYYGNDVITLLRAVKAALDWDGGDDTEPVGWDKNAFTGEYSSHGTLYSRAKGSGMIRTVYALGMLVDVLEWDGNIDELRGFGPDEIIGETDEGVMLTGSMRGIADGFRRHLRPGDLLIRPAGRADITPLHMYRDIWWTQELGLLDEST